MKRENTLLRPWMIGVGFLVIASAAVWAATPALRVNGIDLGDGSSLGVSATGHIVLRNNAGTLQQSVSGGAYTGIGGGASTGNFTFSSNSMDLTGAAAASLCGTTATSCTMSPTSTATTFGLTVTVPANPSTGGMAKFTDGTHDVQLGVGASSYPKVTTSQSNLAFFNAQTTGIIAASSTEVDVYVNGSNTAKMSATAAIAPVAASGKSIGDSALPFSLGYFGAAVASQPTCDANHRGGTMTIFATTGNSDTLQVCMKAAADTYAWRTVYTAP